MEEDPVVGGGEDHLEPEEMNLMTAVQQVLKKALVEDQLARGHKEATKALNSGDGAKLCLLAQDCDEEQYTKVIEALCREQSVHLIRVPEKLQLGEWAGQCKIDPEGNATKVRASSCVVVKEFGEQSAGLDFLLEHIKSTEMGAGGDED